MLLLSFRLLYVSDLHRFIKGTRQVCVLSFGHLSSFNIIIRICQSVSFLSVLRIDCQQDDSTDSDAIRVDSSRIVNIYKQPLSLPGGGGVLPYLGYTGTCRWTGYGFLASLF